MSINSRFTYVFLHIKSLLKRNSAFKTFPMIDRIIDQQIKSSACLDQSNALWAGLMRALRQPLTIGGLLLSSRWSSCQGIRTALPLASALVSQRLITACSSTECFLIIIKGPCSSIVRVKMLEMCILVGKFIQEREHSALFR